MFSVLAASLCVAAPATAQTDQVAAYTRTFIERRHIPSAAVAVVRDGKLLMSGGYGTANLELNVPAGLQTVYEIGSISKQFAATAIVLLAERGRLGISDPIAKYLPGLPESWSGITVRHLLTHSSGLPDWESRTAFSYRGQYTPADFLKLVTPLPLDFAPGARFSYTNTGAPILGMIVQAVSGTDYEQFVVENLFRPTGLTATRFKHWDDIVPNRSGGYVEEEGILKNGEPHRPRVIAPSGGIMSTAADLASWLAALGEGHVVNAASLEQMAQPVRLNNGVTFSAGMGWFLDAFHGHRVMLHNGSTVGGYSSVVYWYPDDRLGVAILMNIDRFNAVNVLAQRVAGMYIPALSAANLAERADPDSATGRRLLELLNAVGQDRDSEMLAPNLRNPGGPVRTTRSFGFVGTPDRFAFLEREDLGSAGVMRFGNLIRAIYRYKLVAGSRIVHYTFEMTPQERIARFLAEEE